MSRFRSWSRRAWILHGYLLAMLVLQPVQTRANWVDTNSDGTKDSWTDLSNSTRTLAQLNAISLDIDDDGAYNEEELAYGSDPLDYDTDDDGLNDGDEIHLAIEQGGKTYSLTAWDSDGDEVSDFDDFYGFFGVTYPGGTLSVFDGSTYSDYDGDGLKNPFDPYPADPANNDADEDGIDDASDPVLGDAANPSPYNGMEWGGTALGDDDNDAILNFWDAYPADSANGNTDPDGDGIDNDTDPFPTDNANYSAANGINWYGDVLGDADGDGVLNYEDAWPYDTMNGYDGGAPDPNDNDGDGIANDLDPAPQDPNNYSDINGYNWYGSALEDADNDGTINFNDPYPYDPYDAQPDFDGDGWENADDPFPTDATNYSPFNGITWGTTLFDDPDNDGTPNWQDEYPNDTYNGNPDADGDDIPNDTDPYPTDGANYSDINQISWGSNVLGDDDNDGILNWQDETPYPDTNEDDPDTDADDDTLDDSIDPAPDDASNYSSSNGISWYGNALGDDDSDTILNFYDEFPFDSNNGDTNTYDGDGDGIPDNSDPALGDPTNCGSYNGISWYSNALGDEDNDGIPNFYDYTPYNDENADSDGDDVLDLNDPAPNDPDNYSSYNYRAWYGFEVLLDNDGDGTPNFYDGTPDGEGVPLDEDGDGLNAEEEAAWGASDTNPDSDGDGLSDGDEVHVYGSSPANFYSISQGLGRGNLYSDAEMVDGTDTDGDGLPDRIEQHYGLNPHWSLDALLDRDNNGINNITQYLAGVALNANLSTYDADNDGMTDVFEDAWHLAKFNPDDAVGDMDWDGVLNYEEQLMLTCPMNAYTLGPNSGGDLLVLIIGVRYPDGSTPPADDIDPYNGVPDWADAVMTNPTAPDYSHFTRELYDDLDGDGMPDEWEHHYGFLKHPVGGLNLRDARDALKDPDHDGLNNLTEYLYGSDPLVGDSLHDGTSDSSRLYGMSITPRTLNGLTTRYQPQTVEGYTGSRDDVPLTLTPYRTGGDEEEPPPDDPGDRDIWREQRIGISSYNGTQTRSLTETYNDWVNDPFVDAVDVYSEKGFWHSTFSIKIELREIDYKNDTIYKFRKTINHVFSDFVEILVPCGQSSSQTFVLEAYSQTGALTIARLEFMPETPPEDDPPFEDPGGSPATVSVSDSAGSRYRKISLTGVPLPDAKPQVQDESGERAEETHIDAYNRHLQHGVTDIYASDPTTLLPLSVRRDVTSEIWTRGDGMNPSERPDLPFGPCWSSNLCAFVKFGTAPGKSITTANIHDEQGVAQKFLMLNSGPGNWQHSREEMTNARTLGNTFDGLVLTKKFGTTCTYTMCDFEQHMPNTGDGETGSVAVDLDFTYARLTQVTDRLGNRLLYEYANDTTLIPSRVYDPDRPGREISVMHQNGRVSAVRGPAGEEVLYTNGEQGLTSVTRGTAAVQYTYLTVPESDKGTTHNHIELASISDELNQTYLFDYLFDRSVVYVHASLGGVQKQAYRTGQPMQIVKVTLPNGQAVNLSGSRITNSSYGATPLVTATDEATTQVTGPAGTFDYVFSQPHVFLPPTTGPGLDDYDHNISVVVTYTQLDLTSAAGTETYTFTPDAIFALSSATDLSGNTHSFTYGTDGFDDPIQETDALNHSKTFTYDATTRVMTSMTDQTGVVTSYEIQPGTGLKLSETVARADGTVERYSSFEYDHPVFHGFMTKSTVDASSADTAPATVTHYSLGTGSLGWAEVTETTPTATGDISTTTVHDLSGNKRSVIDGRGLVTNFGYDEHLRLTRVTHPDDSHKDMTYDGHGNLIRETNENGVATFHAYDVFNRRIQTAVDLNGNGVANPSYGTDLPTTSGADVTYSGDIVATTSYNMRGQVVTQTDPRGKLTTNTYDAAGRLLSTNDGGLITTMVYGDNSGGSVFESSGFKPTKITDPRGTITELKHDKMYRTTEQKVTYRNDVPAQHLLHTKADTAQQNYVLAQSHTTSASSALDAATTTLHRANLLCDPAAVAAAVTAAEGELQAAQAVVTAKTTLRDLCISPRNAADAAYQAALTAAAPYDDAVEEKHATTLAAMSAHTDAVNTAQMQAAAIVTAQQTVADRTADAVEPASNVGVCAGVVTSALSDLSAAQDTAALAAAALALAESIWVEGDPPLTGYIDARDAADAAVTAAYNTWSAAVAAKAVADTALTNAQKAVQAASDALNALPEPQTDFSELLAAVAAAQADEDSALAAQQSAHGPVIAALAVLTEKTGLLDAAEAVLFSAQNAAVAAQSKLDLANADAQYLVDIADDTIALEGLQTARDAAQTAFDNATAALASRVSEEAAALGLRDATQQTWAAVQARLGSNAAHTATTTTAYDNAGRPTQVKDALNRVTYTNYDVFGQIQSVIHPDDTTVSTAYTHHGKPWKVTDELGNVTETEFDAAGRAVKTIAPAIDGVSAITSMAYDAAGNAIRVTDPMGRVTESQYDERNRVVAVYAPPVWDAEGGVFVRPKTQSTYDALGQALTVTDPQGHVTTKKYDRAGRNWKVIAPEVEGVSPTTVTQFDPGGLALAVTNPLDQTVTNVYDIHGRLTSTTEAGIVNTFSYDDVGNRTKVKDGKNQETTFGYDGLKRLVWQIFANGDTWTYAYDAVRKSSQTSPREITTSYTYDERDHVLTTSAPAHGDTPALGRTYGYDDAGHLLSVTETGNTAADVSYTYDALGRVLTETSRGVQHSYGYDLAGNRTQADYGTGRSVQTGYDEHNRPSIISEGGRVTRYGYDACGRAVMLMAANGQFSFNTYDALGRLVDRTLTSMGWRGVAAEFSWEHDALGNVTQQLETWPGDESRGWGIRSTVMTYDGNNRLHTETVTEDLNYPTTGVTATTYTYDHANNRSQKTVTGGSDPGVWHYTYNEANQLTRWEQWDAEDSTLFKSASLKYDASGNRTSQTVSITGGATGNGISPPPAASGTTRYEWDAQDRLRSVTMPDGQTQYAYEYDYRTRRIGTHKVVSGVQQKQTAIVFAGGLSLAEYDSETSSLPTIPTVEYTRGPDMGGGVGGMLYSMRASGTKYSLSNGRGDIVAQADSSATLTWTASYEAYGRRTKETGENLDKQRGNSKDEDPTGLLNEGFRYRDLETGVWTTRDPAGFVDGPNLYGYVRQNPWTHWDPLGLYNPEHADGSGSREWVDSSGYQHVTSGKPETNGHALSLPAPSHVPHDGVAAVLETRLNSDLRSTAAHTKMAEEKLHAVIKKGDTSHFVSSVATANDPNGGVWAYGMIYTGGARSGSGGVRIPMRPIPRYNTWLGKPEASQKPTQAYNRQQHYGKTPTPADRKAMGAQPGEVLDHSPSLVKRFYEGDPGTGEKPGHLMTPEERKASAGDRSRMQRQPEADSQKQGGQMKKYSQDKKKEHGL